MLNEMMTTMQNCQGADMESMGAREEGSGALRLDEVSNCLTVQRDME